MKKSIAKLIVVFLLFLLMVSVCIGVSSCEAFASKISTIEQLYAMKRSGSYRLECDLDLHGAAWKPVEVANFYGNGHTISNASINEVLDYNGGFFTKAKKISNVFFENIISVIRLSPKNDYPNCGIVVGVARNIENVTVRFCEMNLAVSNHDYYFNNYGIVAGTCEKDVSNVVVEDSSIFINTGEYCGKTFYIGSVVGWAQQNVRNCKVVNANIKLVNNDKFNSVNFGGVVGFADRPYGKENFTIENCYFANSVIEVQSVSAYAHRIGGIVGTAGYSEYTTSVVPFEVSDCGTFSNRITISSDKNYTVGGVVGYTCGSTDNCLSDSNQIGCSISGGSEQDAVNNVGGVCGLSYGSISLCVAQDNNISGVSSGKSSNISVAGIVGKSEGAVNKCAVYCNYLSGHSRDVFTKKGSTAVNCYVVDQHGYRNDNNVTELKLEEWNTIMSKLSMDSGIWIMTDGKLSMIHAEID